MEVAKKLETVKRKFKMKKASVTVMGKTIINPYAAENRMKAANKTEKDAQLFLHAIYHPKHVSRKRLRDIYIETLEPPLKKYNGIEKMTVAYHQPKNLRNLLVPSKLHQKEGEEVSQLFETFKKSEK